MRRKMRSSSVEDGFSIFALLVVVLSVGATAVLLAWQVSKIDPQQRETASLNMRSDLR